jgi:hypothetical protein
MKLRNTLAVAACAAVLLGSVAAPSAMAGKKRGKGGIKVSQKANGGRGGNGGGAGGGGNVICQNIGGNQVFGGGVPAGPGGVLPAGTVITFPAGTIPAGLPVGAVVAIPFAGTTALIVNPAAGAGATSAALAAPLALGGPGGPSGPNCNSSGGTGGAGGGAGGAGGTNNSGVAIN